MAASTIFPDPSNQSAPTDTHAVDDIKIKIKKQDLECPVSLENMETPVRLVVCGHAFDAKSLTNIQFCPTCRKPIATPKGSYVHDKFLQNLLELLKKGMGKEMGSDIVELTIPRKILLSNISHEIMRDPVILQAGGDIVDFFDNVDKTSGFVLHWFMRDVICEYLKANPSELIRLHVRNSNWAELLRMLKLETIDPRIFSESLTNVTLLQESDTLLKLLCEHEAPNAEVFDLVLDKLGASIKQHPNIISNNNEGILTLVQSLLQNNHVELAHKLLFNFIAFLDKQTKLSKDVLQKAILFLSDDETSLRELFYKVIELSSLDPGLISIFLWNIPKELAVSLVMYQDEKSGDNALHRAVRAKNFKVFTSLLAIAPSAAKVKNWDEERKPWTPLALAEKLKFSRDEKKEFQRASKLKSDSQFNTNTFFWKPAFYKQFLSNLQSDNWCEHIDRYFNFLPKKDFSIILDAIFTLKPPPSMAALVYLADKIRQHIGADKEHEAIRGIEKLSCVYHLDGKEEYEECFKIKEGNIKINPFMKSIWLGNNSILDCLIRLNPLQVENILSNVPWGSFYPCLRRAVVSMDGSEKGIFADALVFAMQNRLTKTIDSLFHLARCPELKDQEQQKILSQSDIQAAFMIAGENDLIEAFNLGIFYHDLFFAQYGDGKTLLMHFASCGSLNVVKFYGEQYSGYFTREDNAGHNILWYALEAPKNTVELVRYLVKDMHLEITKDVEDKARELNNSAVLYVLGLKKEAAPPPTPSSYRLTWG